MTMFCVCYHHLCFCGRFQASIPGMKRKTEWSGDSRPGQRKWFSGRGSGRGSDNDAAPLTLLVKLINQFCFFSSVQNSSFSFHFVFLCFCLKTFILENNFWKGVEIVFLVEHQREAHVFWVKPTPTHQVHCGKCDCWESGRGGTCSTFKFIASE